jgi:acetyl-CoA carboxylase biotin carboxylase subunit
MLRALGELRVVGIETSAPFHRRVLREPDFQAGRLDIRYLETHPELLERSLDDRTLRDAAVAAALLAEEERERRAIQRVDGRASNTSRWRDMGWRS